MTDNDLQKLLLAPTKLPAKKPKNYKKPSLYSGKPYYQDKPKQESNWTYNPNYPTRKELLRKQKTLNSFQFSGYLDALMSTKMREDLDNYKNALYEKRDGDDKEMPEYKVPNAKDLEVLAKKAGGKDGYLYSRFITNLEKNKVVADYEFRKDQKYEKKNPYLPKPGESGYDNVKDIDKSLIQKDSKKLKKGDRYYAPDKKTIIQEIDDKAYVEKRNKKGERVYYNVMAWQEANGSLNFNGGINYEAKKKDDDFHGLFSGPLGFARDKFARPVGHAIDAAAHWGPVEKVGHGLGWTLDKLMRLGYGAQAASQYIIDQDEENGGWYTKMGLGSSQVMGLKQMNMVTGGRNYSSSVDDMDLGDYAGVFKAFGKGVMKKKGAKIDAWENIKHNAKEDNVKNLWDQKGIQLGSGMGSAVMLDPVSFVSFGPRAASAAAQGGEKLFGEAENLRKAAEILGKSGIKKKELADHPLLAEEVANLTSKGRVIKADDIFELIGGNMPKKFETVQARNAAENKARAAQEYFLGRVEQGLDTTATIHKRKKRVRLRDDLHATLNAAKQARDSVAAQRQSEVIIDDVVREMETQVERGVLPAESVARVHDDIDELAVEEMLGKNLERIKRERGTADSPIKRNQYPMTPEGAEAFARDRKAWAESVPSIDESLTHSLRGHPDINPEDILGNVEEGIAPAHKAARRWLGRNEPKYHKTSKIRSVEDRTKRAEAALARRTDEMQAAGKTSAEILKDPSVKKYRRTMTQGKKEVAKMYESNRRLEANATISTIRGRAAARKEGRNVLPKDEQRAIALENLSSKLDDALEKTSSQASANVRTLAEANPAGRTLDEAEEARLALNIDGYTTEQLNDPAIINHLMNPSNWGAYDEEQHLLALGKSIEKAMEANQAPVGKYNWSNMEVPARFKTEEGKVNKEAIAEVLAHDPESRRVFSRNKTLSENYTPEEKQFINQLEEEVVHRQEFLAQRAIGNKRRGLVEKQTAVANAIKDSGAFNRALNIDPAKASNVEKALHRAAKAIEPFYKPRPGQDKGMGFTLPGRNGKGPVFYPAGNKESLAEALEAGGYKILPQTTKKAERLQKVLSGDPKNISKSDLREIQAILRSAGHPAPTGRKFFQTWLKDNGHVAADITGERLTWLREFHATNDMHFNEALRYQNAFQGKTVLGNSTFHQRFPEGITRSDFMDYATGSLETFRQLFKKSPFSLKATTHGEKIAGAQIDRTKPNQTLAKIINEGFNFTYKGKSYQGNPQSVFLEGNLGKVPEGLQKAYNTHYDDTFNNATQHLWTRFEQDPEEALKVLDNIWDTYHQNAARAAQRSAPKTQRSGDVVQDLADEVSSGKAAAMDAARAKSGVQADLTPQELDEIYDAALVQAHEDVISNADKVQRLDPQAIRFEPSVGDGAAVANTQKKVMAAVEREQKAQIDELKVAKESVEEPAELAAINAKIADIEKQIKNNDRALKTLETRARKVREATARTLKEDALAQLIHAEVARRQPGFNLRVGLYSRDFNLPTSEKMHAAASALSSEKMVDKAIAAYESTFRRPYAGMNPEIARESRAFSNTTNTIIRTNLDRLDKALGSVPPNQRKEAFAVLASPHGYQQGTNAVADAILDMFDELLPVFNGTAPHGVDLGDIQRFLPRHLMVDSKTLLGGLPNSRALLQAFANHRIYPELGKDLNDPINLLWNLTIAKEQAQGFALMRSNLQEFFGIQRSQWHTQMDKISRAEKRGASPEVLKNMQKRLHRIGDDMIPEDHELAALIEKYKDLGYRTVDRKGFKPDFYYPEEIAREIEKVVDMFSPEHIGKVAKFIDKVTGDFNMGTKLHDMSRGPLSVFDKATGTWKMASTIYNPGYYVRNLIGEVMTGWLGGVTNPAYYKRSQEVLKYMRVEHDEVAEMVSKHGLWAEHLASNIPDGTKVIARLGNGSNLTIRDVVALYHENGLKTGFLNTERASRLGEGKGINARYNRHGEKRLPVKAHEGIRRKGEAFEDWPRLAHYIHSLENAPKGMSVEEAAVYAAEQVRKYHFDYSDVTRFEQSVMARMFPFYKWTRKAMPLMAQSLFLKPGKMTAYNKSMAGMTHALSENPEEALDGYMPKYEGTTPYFIQLLNAYQIGEDEEGKNTFLRIATPGNDAIQAMVDPIGTGVNMANPFIKKPLEFLNGETYGNMKQPTRGGSKVSMFLDNLSMPQATYFDKVLHRKDDAVKEPGAIMDEATASFWSGLGIYEDHTKITDSSQPTVIS